MHQEASTQNSRPNIRGKIDIAWAHCKLIREGDKIAMMCIYYDKTIRRDGINRLKGHSAGEMGQVSLCKKVPLDVCYQMKHNIEENKSKNKNRRIDEEHDFYPPSEEGGEVPIEVEQQSEQTQRTTKKVKTSGRVTP